MYFTTPIITLLILFSCSQALIHQRQYNNIENGGVFIQNFGFNGDGRIQLKVTDIQVVIILAI